MNSFNSLFTFRMITRLSGSKAWLNFAKHIFTRSWNCRLQNCMDQDSVMEQNLTNQDKLPLPKKFTVAIEGNIASGKTSLLQYFSRFPEAMIYQEPVDKWRDVKGYNLLNLMYKDTSRWSLAFQTYVQLTMTAVHKQKHEEKSSVKLMERSLFSARYCFVENLFQRGQMTDPEYIILAEWFDWLIANEDIHLDLIVYLRTTPEISLQRIRQRHRPEEATIPLEYLKHLHDLHEDWLLTQRKFSIPCPVLVLDASCGFDEMKVLFEKYTNEILCCNGVSTHSVPSVSVLSSA